MNHVNFFAKRLENNFSDKHNKFFFKKTVFSRNYKKLFSLGKFGFSDKRKNFFG